MEEGFSKHRVKKNTSTIFQSIMFLIVRVHDQQHWKKDHADVCKTNHKTTRSTSSKLYKQYHFVEEI